MEVPRQSLEADFVIVLYLRASNAMALGTSGAFHWTQVGDSLILERYVGSTDGKLQYRHYLALPILRFGTDSAPIIDAGELLRDGDVLLSGKKLKSSGSPPPALVAPVKTNLVGVTVLVDGPDQGLSLEWDFLRLPKTPMRPRLSDRRVTYLGSAGADGKTRYIPRQRLEKRDPDAALSDVVRPIVYRVDSTVPKQWVPWIKRGVEEWNPVFESLGFRNALVFKDASAPVPEPSPDTREVVIDWDKGDKDGSGGTDMAKADPRSGEILASEISFNEGVVSLMQRYAFVWTGAADPRARYPYPDSVVGPFIQMLVAHEVGHSLGLDHHFNRLSAYPMDSVRSPSFVHRMGYVPSVMGYAYFNYVAQPEDHVDPADLHMRIGPNDRFMLGWGYRPIPGAKTPQDERPTLDRWLAAQDTAPYLRGSLDSTYVLNDRSLLGDAIAIGSDPLKSAEYSIRNLARVAPLLDEQRDDRMALADTLHGMLREEMLQRWLQALFIAVNAVGRTPGEAAGNRPAAVDPVGPPSQVVALHTLLAHVFHGQDEWLSRYVLIGNHGPLVLFDSVAQGWKRGSWRRVQQLIVEQLLAQVRASWSGPARTAADSTVVSGVCAELKGLDAELAAAKPSDEPSKRFRQALRDMLAKAFEGPPPLCH